MRCRACILLRLSRCAQHQHTGMLLTLHAPALHPPRSYLQNNSLTGGLPARWGGPQGMARMRFFFAAGNPLGGEAGGPLVICMLLWWPLMCCATRLPLCKHTPTAGNVGMVHGRACDIMLCLRVHPCVPSLRLRVGPSAQLACRAERPTAQTPTCWRCAPAGTLPPTWGLNGSFPEIKTL